MGRSGGRGVFVAWRKLSSRTRLLAKYLKLGILLIPDIPVYLKASITTWRLIAKSKPTTLFAQIPQGPLLAELVALRRQYIFKLVADVHSGFLVYDYNIRGLVLNAPFKPLLKYCDLVILHNYMIYEKLIPPEVREKSIVVYDPWFVLEEYAELCPKNCAEDYVVVPASFAPDEPLGEVLSALSKMRELKVYVTGNWKRKPSVVSKCRGENIVFTGYLPHGEYYKLLCCAKAIITGTKWEYTALMSAWEALAFKKPLALSYTRTLYSIFKDYAYFYKVNDIESIREAVKNAVTTGAPNESARLELKMETLRQVKVLEDMLSLQNGGK